MTSSPLFQALVAVATCAGLAAADPAPARPTMAKICANCHTPAPKTLRGTFDNLALKNDSFQLKIDETTEVIRFDRASLKVLSHDQKPTLDETLKGIARGHEVRVEFMEKDGAKVASVLSVKPPVSLSEAETVTLAEVEKLVALGPEKGKYFLADCRPAPRFQEGNIPTAVNMPFPAFDKIVDRLPADKGMRIIYYCSGKTCNMSPGSLRKIQKLGYTNARVFVDGMPGWYARHFGVIAPKSFQEVFASKEVPAIVLDLRPAAEAELAAIKGSVAALPGAAKALLAGSFPSAKLKPPVLVVDAEGGPAAAAFADELVQAGYRGVNVLQGGFKAWQSAGLPLVPGKLALKAAYVPKPRAGSVSSDEFMRLASLEPAARKDLVVLDVRNLDETRQGVIKGALLIPEPQLLARLPEVPKDKRVLIHCSTGIRAELAYHLLKEKGFNASFLNGEITIIDTGEFTLD